jgi:hypothetical protein
MRRRWIVGLVAIAAVGGTVAVANAVLGTQSRPTPRYAVVNVDLGHSAPAHARSGGGGGGEGGGGGATKKPQLVYLDSPTPKTINPADVSAGGIGPFIDVKLTGCSKVIDGGVVPSRTDVYVRGSYVQSKSEYHVLISLDAGSLADRTPYTITSNLTCLKGVK